MLSKQWFTLCQIVYDKVTVGEILPFILLYNVLIQLICHCCVSILFSFYSVLYIDVKSLLSEVIIICIYYPFYFLHMTVNLEDETDNPGTYPLWFFISRNIAHSTICMIIVNKFKIGIPQGQGYNFILIVIISHKYVQNDEIQFCT